MAKKYVGVETLEALMQIMKDELAQKASGSDFAQIKETVEKIIGSDGAEGEDGGITVDNSNKLGGIDADQYLTKDDVLDSLEEYVEENDADKLVAAAVIKAINDAMSEIEEAFSDLGFEFGASSGSDDGDDDGDGEGGDDDDETEAPKSFKDVLEETMQGVVDDTLGEKVGQKDGIASLDENGKVPSSQLPSYVDDVLEGYLVDEANYEDDEDGTVKPDLHFYAPTTPPVEDDEDDNEIGDPEVETGEQGSDGEGPEEKEPWVEGPDKNNEIKGERGIIYVDLTTGMSYRWSGSMFVEISSGMEEMTAAEVEAIWNSFNADDDEEEEEVENQVSGSGK